MCSIKYEMFVCVVVRVSLSIYGFVRVHVCIAYHLCIFITSHVNHYLQFVFNRCASLPALLLLPAMLTAVDASCECHRQLNLIF